MAPPVISGAIGVGVDVWVGVLVGVPVSVGVLLGVKVAVIVGVSVGVDVAVKVGVIVGVGVNVEQRPFIMHAAWKTGTQGAPLGPVPHAPPTGGPQVSPRPSH